MREGEKTGREKQVEQNKLSNLKGSIIMEPTATARIIV